MTVGAVVVGGDARDGLADAYGRAAARRIVEAAWAGGALPIVVVADDPDGVLAAALMGTPARLVPLVAGAGGPAGVTGGPAGATGRPAESAGYALGSAAAREAVLDTDALILWPMRMTWVDPETVTSLIEAHGVRPDAVLRPAWEGAPAWPMFVPSASLAALLDDGAAGDLEAALRATSLTVHLLDLGDPGTGHDRSTPLESLPAYEGPAEPAGGPPPEWGAAAADRADDQP